MAKKYKLEIDSNIPEVVEDVEELNENLEQTGEVADETAEKMGGMEKGVQRTTRAARALGNTLKRSVIGLLIAAVALGKEFVTSFQPVVDTMNTIQTGFTDIISALAQGDFEALKSIGARSKALVELRKQVELNVALSNKDRAQNEVTLETLRQTRDNYNLSFKERIDANNRIGTILESQSRVEKERAELALELAQAEYNRLPNQENLIALTEAETALQERLSQIEGQRSEQLMNQINLERERLEANLGLSMAIDEQNRLFDINFENELFKTKGVGAFYNQVKSNIEATRNATIDFFTDQQALVEQGSAEWLRYEAEKVNASTEATKELNDLDQWLQDNKNARLLGGLQLAAQGLSAINDLFEGNAKAQKAINVSQAIIQSFLGAITAQASGSQLSPFFGWAAFAITLAQGLAGAYKIANTPIMSDTVPGNFGGQGAFGSAPGQDVGPAFNIIEPLTQGLGNIGDQLSEGPVSRSYVTQDDLDNNAELDRIIRGNATG